MNQFECLWLRWLILRTSSSYNEGLLLRQHAGGVEKISIYPDWSYLWVGKRQIRIRSLRNIRSGRWIDWRVWSTYSCWSVGWRGYTTPALRSSIAALKRRVHVGMWFWEVGTVVGLESLLWCHVSEWIKNTGHDAKQLTVSQCMGLWWKEAHRQVLEAQDEIYRIGAKNSPSLTRNYCVIL